MLKYLALGLAALLGGALTGSPAALAQDCVDRAALDRAVVEADAFVVDELLGDDALAWIDAWNAVPPVTDIGGDQVVLVDREGAPSVLVVVFERGCLSQAWEEGRTLTRRLVDQVLGLPPPES